MEVDGLVDFPCSIGRVIFKFHVNFRDDVPFNWVILFVAC